jgi:hypothetical protein
LNAAWLSFSTLTLLFFVAADCFRLFILPPFPFQTSALVRFPVQKQKRGDPNGIAPSQHAEVARRDQESPLSCRLVSFVLF